ncbi:hypothetical protein ENSA5_57980 [Enhygromyxa salina]|uniref:DUF3616 domain-containing protein n=2 Tax=Enhygromyxa salina TaxID=215803 RepID=A0A2S9XE43_9BACT|nr:hypothetical protein ENSA5_57980 [Enhygromyxa salina]
MCDASGAVPLDPHVFAVADDEDNLLRVYDADRGGQPLYSKDISADVGIFPRPTKKPNRPPKPPAEADIEAATMHQGHAYWLTSHGTNSKGKHKPERLRLFATTSPDYGKPLTVVGTTYTNLLDDLEADPRYRPFGLTQAAQIAPKEPGGLNIEGMTDRAAGGVFIGFRNPTPQGKALLVVLENPSAVINGEAARFGDPVLLDLGGLGIRGLSAWRGNYLIIAGDYAGTKPSRLYTWDGQGEEVQVVDADLDNLNPEGFFTPEDRDQIMLLSDDGTIEVDGVACKKLDDPAKKSFRGRWVPGF